MGNGQSGRSRLRRCLQCFSSGGTTCERGKRFSEPGRRLGDSGFLPLLLRTDRGSAFQQEAFRGYLQEHQIEQVFAPVGAPGYWQDRAIASELKGASPPGEPLLREAYAGGDSGPHGTASGLGRVLALLQHPAFAPGAGLPDAVGGCGVREGRSGIVFVKHYSGTTCWKVTSSLVD